MAAYQHDRCHFCSKPVTTMKLVQNKTILCNECAPAPHVIEDDLPTRTDGKQGYEKRGRDDEEEYSRVPIAGENDSDYDIFEDLHDDTYSQESDESEKDNVNKTATNYVAYAIAPNIPGKVAVRTRTKTLTLNNRYDSLYLAIEVEEAAPTMTVVPSSPTRWTSQLLRYQAHHLTMGYKRKSQLRAKLMR